MKRLTALQKKFNLTKTIGHNKFTIFDPALKKIKEFVILQKE